MTQTEDEAQSLTMRGYVAHWLELVFAQFDLTPAQRAKLIAKRKAAYEARPSRNKARRNGARSREDCPSWAI